MTTPTPELVASLLERIEKLPPNMRHEDVDPVNPHDGSGHIEGIGSVTNRAARICLDLHLRVIGERLLRTEGVFIRNDPFFTVVIGHGKSTLSQADTYAEALVAAAEEVGK